MLGSTENHVPQDRSACFVDLLDRVNVLAVLMDTQARITYCNHYFSRLTGWSLPEIKGQYWDNVFAVPGSGDMGGLFTDLLDESPSAWHRENELLTKAGGRLCIRWNNMVFRNDAGKIVAAACIGEDVTERHALQLGLLEAASRERLLVQGELHDGLGQELFGMAMTCRSLAAGIQKGETLPAGRLGELCEAADRALETCRRIAHGLSPHSDLSGGLLQSLERLTKAPENWQGPRIVFHYEGPAIMPPLEADSSEHLYRLAQEGIANAIKHAGASEIKITLKVQHSAVVLSVQDDGSGIPPAHERTGGVGLKLMNHRAGLLHAQLRITANESRGTKIELRYPLPGEPGDGATVRGTTQG